MLAAWGFMEWFFAAVLAILVGVIGLFFVYIVARLFVNPARRASR